MHRTATALAAAVIALALTGCSWTPDRPTDAQPARGSWASWAEPLPADSQAEARTPAVQAVNMATGLVGAPYQWGGASPEGFDCSGLVYYTFRKAGLTVPRTSQAQYDAARPVPIAQAGPGDLVFFGQRGRISHVGIYLGDERFVHAPETGRAVTIAHLSDGYYRARFAGAGRID